MNPTTWQLTLRSRPAVVGFVSIALAAIFLYFAGDTFLARRPAASYIGIALFFLCVAAMLLAWAAYGARRDAAIYATGQSADAVITAIRDISFSHGSGGVIFRQAHYRYDASPGDTRHGKSQLLTPQETKGWSPGQRGCVKFDPQYPARSVWIGLLTAADPPTQDLPPLLAFAKRARHLDRTHPTRQRPKT